MKTISVSDSLHAELKKTARMIDYSMGNILEYIWRRNIGITKELIKIRKRVKERDYLEIKKYALASVIKT